MRINYGQKVVERISFLLLTSIFYFYNNYITIGGFGVGYQYIGCILVVGIGFCLFLVIPDLPFLYHAAKAAGVLALSYFVAMIGSAIIWIFTFTPIRQMISGFFEPAYMMLCVACAMALAYILRERMLTCTFWALTTAFFALLVPRILEFGFAEYLRRLIAYLQSGGTQGYGISLEETSFAYLYVFFAIYFGFHWKELPIWKRFAKVFIIVFALLNTFKRSGLLALAVGFALAFVYFRLGEVTRRYFLNFIMVAFILAAFLYIPFVRYGLFNRIAEALQLRTSHRNEIYAFYSQYYDFGLDYLGRGLGWIQRLRHQIEFFSNGEIAINVHCDYVYYYIELGFWGYLFWMISAFPWVVKWAVKGKCVKKDATVLGTGVAFAMLRLTENISFLYSAVLGFSVIIMYCALSSIYMDEQTPRVAKEGRNKLHFL